MMMIIIHCLDIEITKPICQYHRYSLSILIYYFQIYVYLYILFFPSPPSTIDGTVCTTAKTCQCCQRLAALKCPYMGKTRSSASKLGISRRLAEFCY